MKDKDEQNESEEQMETYENNQIKTQMLRQSEPERQYYFMDIAKNYVETALCRKKAVR